MILGKRMVDLSTEKMIITGMIVSQQFCRETMRFMKLEYFKNDFIKTIAKWVSQYYKDYKTNPYKDIQNIFIKNQQYLSDEEGELISTLLQEISNQYENQKINIEYLIDQAFKYYATEDYTIRAENVENLLAKGDVKGADKQFREAVSFHRQSSDWEDPFSADSVKKVFSQKQSFFKFGGQLGEFLGEFLKGWLVGITGPFKRGKTFFLQEFGIIGVISGLNVVFFSLEMSTKQMFERVYKRITGTGSDNMIFPIFDCVSNQDDTCSRKERVNQIRLLNPDGGKPTWNPNMAYRVCSWCRENDPQSYIKATWKEEIIKPEFDFINVSKRVGAFNRMHKNSFKIKSYPRFSASVADLEADLEELKFYEGFIPDLIIVDYADILKPENPNLVGVEKEDQTWMNLGRMAMERHCLLVTGTQATRGALDAKNVGSKHTARWIGKLGHVDVMLSLNQTEEEKEEGRMRIGIMEHRHQFFLENMHVTILQKPDMGQIHLDSQI